MVYEINGDALEFRDGIICHQTNYHGVMGAGIAASIRDRLLTKRQYEIYVETCEAWGRDLLGHVQFLKCRRDDVIIANCFCQDEELESDDGNITSYTNMRRCFTKVRNLAMRGHHRICIPYKMGCGIAGGDWQEVRAIIEKVFGKTDLEVVIVRKED